LNNGFKAFSATVHLTAIFFGNRVFLTAVMFDRDFYLF
jgi:hypothetical protein